MGSTRLLVHVRACCCTPLVADIVPQVEVIVTVDADCEQVNNVGTVTWMLANCQMGLGGVGGRWRGLGIVLVLLVLCRP